jgi:hypothetical protein
LPSQKAEKGHNQNVKSLMYGRSPGDITDSYLLRIYVEGSIPSSAFGTPAIGVAECMELFGSFQEGGFPDFTYNVAFLNVPGEPLTSIGTLEQLTMVHEALGAVAVTEAIEYPAGPIVLSDITIEMIDGTATPVSWSVVDDPANEIETTIDVYGPFGALSPSPFE